MKYYTEDHAWVDVSGREATIGISEYAVDELGEITAVELPAEEDDYIVGDAMAVIVSGKKNTDVYCPLSGSVCAVNDEMKDDLSLINNTPEEKGWICKLKDFDTSELDDMMSRDSYQKFLRRLKKR